MRVALVLQMPQLVYNPDTKDLEDGIFLNVNGIGLGDVLQSLHYNEGQVYAVMNNSAQIVVMDSESLPNKVLYHFLKELSPRQMQLLSSDVAYITDLYGDEIHLINPPLSKFFPPKLE